MHSAALTPLQNFSSFFFFFTKKNNIKNTTLFSCTIWFRRCSDKIMQDKKGGDELMGGKKQHQHKHIFFVILAGNTGENCVYEYFFYC